MAAPSTFAHQSQSMNAPMPPAHEKAVLGMLTNMEELSSLYVEELDAIELRDMQKFSDLQPVKDRLVKDCEARMSEISQQTPHLKTLSPALKERVMTAETTLRQLASKSQYACKIRAESVKRIQQRLLDAARYAVGSNQTHYDSNGKTDASRGRPVATAFNEAI